MAFHDAPVFYKKPIPPPPITLLLAETEVPLSRACPRQQLPLLASEPVLLHSYPLLHPPTPLRTQPVSMDQSTPLISSKTSAIPQSAVIARRGGVTSQSRSTARTAARPYPRTKPSIVVSSDEDVHPPGEGQRTGHDAIATPPCESEDGESEVEEDDLFEKPPGYAGRSGSGGYNLQMSMTRALGPNKFTQKKYQEFSVRSFMIFSSVFPLANKELE